MKVISSTRCLLQSHARPPGGEMRFIGCLIGRKSRIAIDAHHHLLRRTYMGRGEIRHRIRHLVDYNQHRLLQLALKNRASLLEPLAFVIALQPAQKLHRLRAEVRLNRFLQNGFGTRLGHIRILKCRTAVLGASPSCAASKHGCNFLPAFRSNQI